MLKYFISIYLLIVGSLSAQDIISQLRVYDQENEADWSIQTNLQVGDAMFGDRPYTIESIPSKYLGLGWIRTANDSKGFAGDTLVSFQLNDSADVYIAYDDRLELRDWLSGWIDTGDDLINSEYQPQTFSLLHKKYNAAGVAAFGSIGQSSGADNYIILIYSPNKSIQNPDDFEFTDKFDIVPGLYLESSSVVISGLTEPASINITGGMYSVNGSEFSSVPSTIQNNDVVKIMLKMADSYGAVSTSKLTIGSVSGVFSARTEDDPNLGWSQIESMLSGIQKPIFPDKDFDITDFGAIGDGSTDCSEAFRSAITACSDSGGGRVIVPEGTFVTGAIHLKNNVNLYVSKNGFIKFSQNPSDFLPVVYTRFEGTECYNYSPPIYAFEQENIAITGPGTIDGGGDNNHWWPWKSTGSSDVSILRQMAEDSIPVAERIFGDGHYLRPNMIQPYRCNNVLIDSVTILNGPMWHIHPVLSNNVTITNVSVMGYGPNNDGCNPESCSNVLIKNCYFDTGDDCIAIKSGRNADGRRINTPTENVIIQNCIMKDGHGGVVIGSEITGGARNIFAEDCYMDSPNLERALRIKTNSIRGGIIENIYLRNITVGEVDDAAIRVNFYYQEGDIGNFDPIVKNVEVRNLTCEKADYALRLEGYNRSPITDLRLINCTFDNIQRPNLLRGIQNIVLNNTTIIGLNYDTILEPKSYIPASLKDVRDTPLKKDLILYPNYPNPFNGYTTLSYYLPKKEWVNMEIYNILGQRIQNIFNGIQNPGIHTIRLNSENFGSGLYFYKILTKNSFQTGRFVVIK